MVPAVGAGGHHRPGRVAPPEVIAAEEDLAAEQGHQGAGGVARHRDQAQIGVEIQGLLPLQQVFGPGGGVAVGGVDPAGAAEALRPAVVIRHVIAVTEHDRRQAAQGFDLPGQGRVEAGGVDQHVPRRPHDQIAAGPEAAPRRPAAVVHLPGRMAGEPGRKAIGGSAPHQCGGRLDRRHRTGAQGQQGLGGFRLALRLVPDVGRVAAGRRGEVLRIPLPAGAAVNAACVHEEGHGCGGADPILAPLLFLYRELLAWEWSRPWVFPSEIAGRTRPREKKAATT